MIDTKSFLDNVFLKMKVSVQYQVIRNQVGDAYYRLEILKIKLHLMFLT